MHRRLLLEQLERYRSVDDAEADAHRRISEFVRAHSDCFERSLSIGHVTGSAWLLDESGERALLTFHKKLGKWLQLGGHADGDPDPLSVALREAREESGIASISAVSEDIFDLDVHAIPARGHDAEHFHYDVRFLCQVRGHDAYTVSEESRQLAWVSKSELAAWDVDDSVRRMYRKWLAL